MCLQPHLLNPELVAQISRPASLRLLLMADPSSHRSVLAVDTVMTQFHLAHMVALRSNKAMAPSRPIPAISATTSQALPIRTGR
jgi:hypothetical protein